MKGWLVVLFLVVYFSASAVFHRWGRDDSDPPDGRSGMIIFTDHLTGCQYLSRPFFSSLTPRLGADGKPVCSPSK